jgi:protease secretion system membrane fusion protein
MNQTAATGLPGLAIPAPAPISREPDGPGGVKASRIGTWALGIGVAGFFVWAAFAPLDEGVPAPGSVVLDTKRKAVQHLTGGIVQKVLVREGDTVAVGQPLIELDSATARANYEAVRQRYLSLRATEGRLQAEQTGASAIRFHADLQAAALDPAIGGQVAAQMAAQEQLFLSRRAALEADLQGIEESIQGQKGLIAAYRGMLDSRGAQLALLKEELATTRGLVEEGYAPRNRQLELQRMVADAQSAIADLQGNLVRATRSIGELAQRGLQRRSEYRQETATQLAEVLREVQADEQKFHAAQEELARMVIRSPAAGQVVGLETQTVGAVIQPAQRLMDVVPGDEKLLLEARVPPHLIDRLHESLPVDARFASFAHTPQLVVEGRVATVSADLLTDPQTQVSYYLARVALTPEGREALGKRVLQPGMPVELVFKTGERSLLTYLLHPLTKRVAASLTEE